MCGEGVNVGKGFFLYAWRYRVNGVRIYSKEFETLELGGHWTGRLSTSCGFLTFIMLPIIPVVLWLLWYMAISVLVYQLSKNPFSCNLVCGTL